MGLPRDVYVESQTLFLDELQLAAGSSVLITSPEGQAFVGKLAKIGAYEVRVSRPDGTMESISLRNLSNGRFKLNGVRGGGKALRM